MEVTVKFNVRREHIEVAIQSLVFDYWQTTKSYNGQIITKRAVSEQIYTNFRLYGANYEEQLQGTYDFIEDIETIADFWGSKLYPDFYSVDHAKMHNREKQLKKLGIK